MGGTIKPFPISTSAIPVETFTHKGYTIYIILNKKTKGFHAAIKECCGAFVAFGKLKSACKKSVIKDINDADKSEVARQIRMSKSMAKESKVLTEEEFWSNFS